MTIFNSFQQADTIAGAAAVSTGVQINNIDIVGLEMPAGWDAASITLQASRDGAAWFNVYDQFGTELTLTTAASRYIAIPPSLLAGVGYIRIRSGTSATPVNQTAARTLVWLMRNYAR